MTTIVSNRRPALERGASNAVMSCLPQNGSSIEISDKSIMFGAAGKCDCCFEIFGTWEERPQASSAARA